MFPTCSNRLLAGRNALSATDLTIVSSGPARRATRPATDKCIPCGAASATHNHRLAGRPDLRAGDQRPNLRQLAGGMFPAPWGRDRHKRLPSAATPRVREAAVAVARRARCSRVGVAACGSGKRARTPTSPPATSRSQVNTAKFPTDQQLAETTTWLAIKNAGDEQIPDLAVTIYTGDEQVPSGSFSGRAPTQPGARRPQPPGLDPREQLPEGARARRERAARSTRRRRRAPRRRRPTPSSSAPLGPGETKNIVWRVTPVRGRHLHGPLRGRGGTQRQGEGGDRRRRPVKGEFVVTISDKPPQTCVDGSGKVVTRRSDRG